MNKLEQLANDKFGGDLEKTFDYMFTQMSPEEQNSYIDGVTSEQIQFARELMIRRAKEKNVDIGKIVKEEVDLAYMSLTKDEVTKMEVNPFKAKLGKDVLKFVVLNAGFAAVYLIASNFDSALADNFAKIAVGTASILTTYLSFDTIKDIMNYFKFNKLSKQFKQDEQEKSVAGRGM